MSRVRAHGNKSTEIALAVLFRQNSVTGWCRHAHLVGKPDFVFRERRVAVFVDGCFWHGCPKHASLPASNRSFWRKKIAANRARDRLVNRTLRKEAWRVVRIWEHALGRRNEACIRRIKAALAP
jgi:DNA mismatch endonuclease, patch repair protein